MTRHTPSTITREISLSAMDLRDQMLRAGLTHLFVESTTVTTASGTSTYAITDGYYQVLSVELTISSTNRVPLTRCMEGERAHLRSTTATYPSFYQLVGSGSIELLPTPAGVYTVTVRRIPVQPPLIGDSDTLNGLNGLEEWVVCDVVRKLAASEKDWPTVQSMDASCTRLAERIATMSRMVDRAGNKRVVDVRSRRRRFV